MIELECKKVIFFSPQDETAYFACEIGDALSELTWLFRIKSLFLKLSGSLWVDKEEGYRKGEREIERE